MDTKISWSNKKPINGIDCFFSEESFNKYSGIPSTLEERLLMRIRQMKGEPVCPSVTHRQSETASDARFEPPESADGTVAMGKKLSDKPTKPKGKIDEQKEKANSKTKNAPEAQGKQKKRVEPPLVKKIAPPRKSRFSHDQQKRYVYLYRKYSHKTTIDTTEEERMEMRELQLLTKEVLEEQAEFQQFQETLANTCHKTDYTYMHPAARSYMEDYIQSRKKEAELYPKYYNAEKSFEIDGEGSLPKMVYIKPLLQLGVVPKMILPTVNQQLKPELPLDSPAVNQQYPVSKNRNCKPSAWNHEPCSIDQNAEHLAVENRAHIVISSGALQCLVDNHAPKHLEHWEMPITVKDFPLKEGDKVTVHRVVFIDRPFLPPQLTPKEKNTKYFKTVLKSFIAKPLQKGLVFSKLDDSETQERTFKSTPQVTPQSAGSNECGSSKRTAGKKRSKNGAVKKEEPFCTEDVSLEDLECFGTAKKKLNSLSKHKQTPMLDTGEDSQSQMKNELDSVSAIKHKKFEDKGKSFDSDQDLLRKIREMHKTPKGVSEIQPVTQPELETKEVKTDSCEITSDFQEGFQETDSQLFSDNDIDKKTCEGCEVIVITEAKENANNIEGNAIKNIDTSAGNEFSQRLEENKTVVLEKSELLTIPWRTPEPINENKKSSVSPRKSRRLQARSVAIKSEEDSSEDEEDKLYIMESPTKKMEVIEDAPASPSPASPEPDISDMEVCKIIPIGSDYASDSVQSPPRKQESPASPEKGGVSGITEAFPCPIIPLCRESEDESGDLSSQVQTLKQVNLGSDGGFDKPYGTPLRRSNRHKSPSQSLESLSAESDQNTNFACKMESAPIEGKEENSDSEVIAKKRKCKKDVITSESEDDIKEAKKKLVEPVKKRRGRPRKNPMPESVEPKENESMGKVVPPCRMTTRSKSSVGGTSEDETSEKEMQTRGRRKRKSETEVFNEINTAAAKSVKENLKAVKSQVAENDKQALKVSAETSAVGTNRMRSLDTENILGKIGPQRRVSHVGKQTMVPASNPEFSQQSDVKARGGKKASKPTNKTEDEFSLDNILSVQQKLLKSSEEQNIPANPVENVDHIFKFPMRNNVTYNLWDLGGFKVIVRCNIHGVIRDLNQQLSFIHLIPKLEYQCQFGMEQVTASETARTWISSYIRPSCRVLRARFHTQRTELVSLEELQAAQLIPPTQSFSPGKAFLMLQNIFHHLHQLSPGQYLLAHKKFSDKCVIKKATEGHKRGSYDLHFQQLGFADPDFDKMKVPWIPLDPAIMIPYHTLNGRIPLTFDPSDFKFNFTSQNKTTKRKKKNRGKRNKGKAKIPASK
ncbi:little elongation complex subunit 2 [Magallana gigas]|uniref:little elongation complex subunit 2 n=1 Tax=Magallana gigas TaxID=29159 RepID=UPI00334040CD